MAVLLNQGTNIFLGETSDVTASISAILQLALSMDYSIILMNRYRQELAKGDDRESGHDARAHGGLRLDHRAAPSRRSSDC